ncbi:Clavaminate synthase-like protein [Coniochaeta sp. PMI_546]|nr:Clavaminate synthase-like protein [Coniochaeta sp. PMI_546]
MPHSTSPTSSLSSLPPFPSSLPHAPIARISSSQLLSSDPAASAAVLQASQTYGFFYLDLRDSEAGRSLISESERLLALARASFEELSPEEKNGYHLLKGVSLFGYKAAGTVKQTDASRRPDSTEFWNVGKDHMHGIVPSRPYPDVIAREGELFRGFMARAHGMGMVVCRALETGLGLERGELEGLNRFDMPSGDHVRLTRKKAVQDRGSVGLPSHTDFGSVTILFNWLGGLQIEGRTEGREGEWEWVVPVEGHAVVNLGDAMVTFTNGALKSAKHRVVPAPGEQGLHDRYSVVYFVRPHNDALMKPLPKFDDGTQVKVAGKFQEQVDEGKVYSAGEWMVRRAAQLGN